MRTIKNAFDLAIRERLGHSAGRGFHGAAEAEGWGALGGRDRGMRVNFSLKELSRPGKENGQGREEGRA